MSKLTLGFSPCPNDTFIFDALVNKKIDTQGIDFEPVVEDVAALNKRAFQADLAITKLSYHALAYLLPYYELLRAGSALGNNCGPLLIAKQPIPSAHIPSCTIAIPGKYTTANFLLSLAFPTAQHKLEMLFSEIETAVQTGQVDLGLIIHENRFTYQEKGLVKIMDLGEYWETQTQLPIPLGGIAIKRNLPNATKQKVNRLIRESVAYAFTYPKASHTYVREYAQAMNQEVMHKHIQLYVNTYSLDLGKQGQRAINQLFKMAWDKQLIPKFEGNILIQNE